MDDGSLMENRSKQGVTNLLVISLTLRIHSFWTYLQREETASMMHGMPTSTESLRSSIRVKQTSRTRDAYPTWRLQQGREAVYLS